SLTSDPLSCGARALRRADEANTRGSAQSAEPRVSGASSRASLPWGAVAPAGSTRIGATWRGAMQHGLESAQRILIVRLSALGDVVHVLPLLDALRRARPDAHIGWLVEQAN